MDFNCNYCGRAHGDSHIHDCGHSLCFTCSLEECPKCEAEKREVEREVEREAERLEAERTRINEVTECCICMDTIQITNRAVTECGHVFCLGCLLQHLRTKNDCPMCRREVGPPPPPSRRVLRLDDVLADDTLFRRLMYIFNGHRHRREAQAQAPRQEAQAPRRRNIRCGICRQPGHNRRTCRVAQANAQAYAQAHG